MEAEALKHLKSKYKDRMLQLAFIVAGWSPEPEGRRHGCVIAVDGKFIISTGFNGPDRDWEPEKDCGGSCCRAPIVHAEVNALRNMVEMGAFAGGSFFHTRRLAAYLTKKPCENCFKELVGAGVQAIFWLQDCSGSGCYWTEEREMVSFGTY